MRFRLLAVLVTSVVTLAIPRVARAQDEVSFDYFYTALQSQGEWFATDQYGYVFQPRVAVTDRNWRPYSDGYWSYTDEGWTWLSYEDFGWATYHYGRWTKLASVGWVWVPGYEWAPAWVSWRTDPAYADDEPGDIEPPPVDPDSDYIGWAPLPPNAVLYPGPGPGLVGGIDQVYDVPPELYCFVPIRFFCAPALIVVIVPAQRNFFCIAHTINVTHCHWGNRHGVPFIFAGGPNFARLQPRVPRPIPRFTIDRRAGPPPGGAGSVAFLNQVRGRTLMVTAPRIVPPAGVSSDTIGVPRSAMSVRPPRVKATIAKATPIAGWNTPGVQPQAIAAAREQFKREAAQPRRPVMVAEPADSPAAGSPQNSVPRPGSQANQPSRRVVDVPASGASTATRPAVGVGASQPTEMPSPQAEELVRRQQMVAEQQRRADEQSSPQNPASEAQRQQLLEGRQRSQSEAQAREQAWREQQVEQSRQAQAAAQAQRQQQIDAQRQAQIERQRRAQAEAQARVQAQRDATRQQQIQAEQQRRAVEAQRRLEAARAGAQPTQTP